MGSEMRSLAAIVAGTILTTGLIIGNPAEATHLSCTEVAEGFINFVNEEKEKGKSPIGGWSTYADFEEKDLLKYVAPDEYNRCLVETFEKGAEGYTISVIKRDPRYRGMTRYIIIKKEEQTFSLL